MIGERAFSDIRVFRGDQPVGVGFVLDSTHVMTCAHVVADALRPRVSETQDATPVDELTIDFPALQPRNGMRVERKAVVEIWRPMIQGVRDDVAILKLTAPIPPQIIPVQACTGWREQDAFRGYGVTKENPEGKIVLGEIVGRLNVNRFQVSSGTQDAAIVPGCSGGAAWNVTRGGVAGMVVQRKLALSAEVIPIELLCGIVSIPLVAEPDVSAARPAAPAGPAGLALRRRLEEFDREPQFADLGLVLDEIWVQRRRAVTCAVGCCDDDRPDVLQRRFLTESLRSYFEAASVSGARLRAEQLAWPKLGNLNVVRELQGLKVQLRRFIPGVADMSAAGFRQAYDLSLQPLVFFSKIEGKTFDESHAALLREWLAFWQDFADGDLRKPLIVFIRFHFDASSGAQAMRAEFEAARLVTEGNGVRALAELSAFEEGDIVAWLGDEMDALDLGDARIPTEIALANHMKGQPIRLGGLLAWAETLSF